jgi:hypothetical protein
MPRSLLFVCITAFLTGCTQTGTYYEADARGGFRKIPDVLPGYQADSATYVINGRVFQYDFRAIGRGEIRDAGPTHLAPGEYKRSLYKFRDAPIFSSGRALFGGIIRRLRHANLTTDGAGSTKDSARDTENMVKRENKSLGVAYRQVNGLRWCVTTRFQVQERARKSVTNRTYHTVISGLLITLYVDFDTSIPVESQWAQRCLDALDRLVCGFRYSDQKPNQGLQSEADSSRRVEIADQRRLRFVETQKLER